MLLVRDLVTFFTDDVADNAAADATLVASFIDISYLEKGKSDKNKGNLISLWRACVNSVEVEIQIK